MGMQLGANPAVFLSNLPRTHTIREPPGWCVVVQEAFPTETARQANILLPAALPMLFANCRRFSCHVPRDFLTLVSPWLDRARRRALHRTPARPRAATTALFERIALPGQSLSLVTGLFVPSPSAWIHAC